MSLRQAGALWLVLLTACASTHRLAVQGAPPAYSEASHWFDVDEVESGAVPTQPVRVEKPPFQQALQQLAPGIWLGAPPSEVAYQLMGTERELEGEWLAVVHEDHVDDLVPLHEGALVPREAEVLRQDYLRWCERRGGGDCLELLRDGPYLQAEDRRILALALAFGSVLEETREALARELLNPTAVVATLVWMAGVYLMLWLVPELASKGIAAMLSVVLVGWLGADALWGLIDGWVRLVYRAHEARTFAQLREAGSEYAKEIGEDAARALILAVAALTGYTLGEVLARVRTLPGYAQAVVQAEAQGVNFAVALETVEAVAASPEGALAVVMLKSNNLTRAGPGGNSVEVAVRHRGGNQQVILGNGQRWHLPSGRSPKDIPASDPVGDQLQDAARRLAKQWGPDKLSKSETDAINKALSRGKYHRALQWERQARGRWVERQLKELFTHLNWSSKGVDVVDPATGYKYEVLSGTDSNFMLHGRRMYDTFFRMISF
jgi:hypothetical protein